MSEVAGFVAFSLGLLTAVSPCPLATNIAAVSVLARQVGSRRAVLWSGLLYALGRTAADVGLGIVVAAGGLGSAEGSQFLQRHLNDVFGPILILLGMVLLGWLGASWSMSLVGTGLQARAARGGMLWAFPLGVLFALSFCPVSAGLFFAGLIPLAAREGSRLWLPALYGAGTALPVIAFSLLLAFAGGCLGQAFDRVAQVERVVRGLAGGGLILVGLHHSLTHVYGL